MEQEKLRVINQLAISVNHEINNPLTGLMGTAELMMMDGKPADDKTRRDLQTIIKQCRRIQEVTARLKNINHLKTVPYGSHDEMLDLIGEIPTQPMEHVTPSHEQFLPTPSILVVDDNPLIIDLIARLFEQRFRIDSVSCASDALSKLDRASYDLILIDLILPEMNGLELFRAIRRIKPRQKVLLTTAYQGDARAEQAVAEGALGCVYKPFQLEELESTFNEVLQGGNGAPKGNASLGKLT
jgi:CheY-like chemotaxis protein